MALRDKAVDLEQNGTNDHVKHIGKQIKTWIDGVTVGSMSKSEMRGHLATSIAGYRDGAIIKTVLNVDDSTKAAIESLINEAKSFAAE